MVIRYDGYKDKDCSIESGVDGDTRKYLVFFRARHKTGKRTFKLFCLRASVLAPDRFIFRFLGAVANITQLMIERSIPLLEAQRTV